jgi:hypothetical protein
MSDPKTVNLLVINACKVEGQHIAVGEILTDVEAELAMELTGAGRTRVATDEEIKAAIDKQAKK